MLIKKGGITRNIDEMCLHEYKAKGYAAVDTEEEVHADPPAGSGEKPIERMNTAELTQKATELGVDISGATTNKLRVELIQAHLTELAKE